MSYNFGCKISWYNITSTLAFFFLFPPLMFAQLPSNQITTMTKLYETLQNDTGISFVWKSVAKNSNPCSWIGVSCTFNESSITELSFNLFSISSSEFLQFVCKIDTLEFLDVSNNHLNSIPDGFLNGCGEISALKLLNFSRNNLGGSLNAFNGFKMVESLDFSHNYFSGEIGLQLEGMDSLKSLNLSHNMFTGTVPTNLGKFNLLLELQLSFNYFTGEIPSQVTKYSNLNLIDLGVNKLSGSIPKELGVLTKLEILVLSVNNLSGGIPNSISNVTTLLRFAANQNFFNETIPSGITLYLRSLDLSYNKLTGTIPSDILSGSNLQSLDLSYNELNGSIPANFSTNLFRLRLGSNSLNGMIPVGSLGSLVELTYLELDNNSLTGTIPSELGMCKKLALLNLGQNLLIGPLPPALGNLTNLQGLNLQFNNFVGEIPAQITLLNRLQKLNISRNSLNGSIPMTISRLKNLANLDLQGNNLSGQIPNSIGSLYSLIELQLGKNQLSGLIPPMPPNMQIALNLSYNLFEGPIPDSLSRLTELEVLDLSNNRFSGEIPDFLMSMTSLTQLVLSNNKLSGVVPNFGSFVALDTKGNYGLIEISTESSPDSKESKKVSTKLVLILILALSGAFALSIVVTIILVLRYLSPSPIKGYWIVDDSILRSNMDFSEAMRAVRKQANIMLKSDFYTYYKALLPGGTNYCVKKLNWINRTFELHSPEKSCNELRDLGQLRNLNIMVPIAYTLTASSVYLFYEYPHYGTLYDFLHGSSDNVVSWEDRYIIAMRVANGLAFLHGYSSAGSPSVLLSLSTRSILMKSPNEPLIGDFELAKMINPSTTMGTLSVVVGAIGYLPPEYPYTMRVTASGIVYSFGVIMLEMLTGKAAVNEGTELAKYVMSMSIQDDKWDAILDYRVSTTSLEVHHQMLSVLKLALRCISISPRERPDAKEVHEMLLDMAQEFSM